jgi:hypothetical protein
MNKQIFYATIRNHFGGKLDGAQVDGMDALLDAGSDLPLHHMANVLAQVRRETGGIMSPIKETVMAHHKDKNPSDSVVVGRLDKAFADGNLPWVKKPYWRTGWFGRGQIQITHKANYDKFGVNKLQALQQPYSAQIAVRGMRDGMFTGRKLSDYTFPAALANPPSSNPRRIVNGPDGSDAEVGRFHLHFAEALYKAGWDEVEAKTTAAPVQDSAQLPHLLALLIAAVRRIFARTK